MPTFQSLRTAPALRPMPVKCEHFSTEEIHLKAGAPATVVADCLLVALEGAGTLDLMQMAASEALADAGLERRDIDGLICGYSTTLQHLML